MRSENEIRRDIEKAMTDIDSIDQAIININAIVVPESMVIDQNRTITRLEHIQRTYPSEKNRKELEFLKADLAEGLNGYPATKRKLANKKDELNEELSNLYSELYEYKQLEETDNAEQRRVDKANAKKLQLLEEEFNTLNRGKFSIQREQNETDDEYLQRMEDVGNVSIDEEGLNADIARETKNVLKSHFKEIIRDNGVIEAIFREFEHRYGEDEAPIVYDKLIQMFPKFKQKILEIFGENPTYGTVSSIVELIENLLTNREVEAIKQDDDNKKKETVGFFDD